MKAKQQKRLALNRETLHSLTSLEHEKLREVVGGAVSWYIWTCTCEN